MRDLEVYKTEDLQKDLDNIIEEFKFFFGRVGKRFEKKYVDKLMHLLELERELTLREEQPN